MRYLLPVFVAALAFGCVEQSADAPNILSEHIKQPILQGSSDFTHRGVLGLAHAANGGFGMCTATLIAPNLLLTARHCVSSLPEDYVQCGVTLFGDPYRASEFYATTDQAMNQNGDWYQATEVLVPDQSIDPCGFDVALIILSQNVTSVPFVVPRIDHRTVRGEIFTAVGYGETAQNNGQSGQRRSRDDLEVICAGPQYCSPGVHFNEFIADTGICQGDSGGPALDSLGRVFGVVSRGASGCLQPAYADVGIWSDWLVETATRAASMGGYNLPEWAATGETGPPPTVGQPEPTGGTDAGGTGGGGDGPGGADTGGAGGADAIEEPPADGIQFEPCNAYNQCAANHLCVSSGTDETFCAQLCAVDAECPPDTWCDTGSGTCAEGGDAAGTNTITQSGGCNISSPATGGSKIPATAFAMFGLAGLALLRRRRR